MIARTLTRQEKTQWNRWLEASHGFSAWRDRKPVRFDGEYTLFAIRLDALDQLRVWTDRDSDDLLITFEIAPGISTVSRFRGGFHHVKPVRTLDEWSRLHGELHAAARMEQLWWGTESLAERPWMTSILHYFAEPFASKAIPE